MNYKNALVMTLMGLSATAFAQPQSNTPLSEPNGPQGAGEMPMVKGKPHPGHMVPAQDVPAHTVPAHMAGEKPGDKMPMLTDAQIVQIIMTTNENEIAAARMEKNHGKSEDVKTFAKDMIDQHTQSNKDLKMLTKKLSMTPEKSPWSDKMHQEGKAEGNRMDKMKGADLDRAYADKQVEMHRHVLEKLDNVFIPQAKNDELKSWLQTTRTTVASHLEHAETMAKSANGQTSTN